MFLTHCTKLSAGFVIMLHANVNAIGYLTPDGKCVLSKIVRLLADTTWFPPNPGKRHASAGMVTSNAFSSGKNCSYSLRQRGSVHLQRGQQSP